jgi:GNAT superfamily N-acetyltransferase
MIEYRKAGGGDVKALVDFRIEFMRLVKELGPDDAAAWRAELSERFSRELASARFVAWLAFDGDSVVAASGLSLRHVGGRTTEECRSGKPAEGLIHNMYTRADYRRRGIAAELLARCLEEGRTQGVECFVLQPTDEGKGIYSRAGFRDSGREMVLKSPVRTRTPSSCSRFRCDPGFPAHPRRDPPSV